METRRPSLRIISKIISPLGGRVQDLEIIRQFERARSTFSKEEDPHERSVSRFLQTIQPPPLPLSSSTNGIKKRKQAAYIVLNTRIYDASPVLREQSRGGDFLPSRKTGLRGAQEGCIPCILYKGRERR